MKILQNDARKYLSIIFILLAPLYSESLGFIPISRDFSSTYLFNSSIMSYQSRIRLFSKAIPFDLDFSSVDFTSLSHIKKPLCFMIKKIEFIPLV